MGTIESKTFKSGNSVAVRLPRELGFAADVAVVIERTGDTITIRPAQDAAAEKRRLDEMIAALRAIGPVGEIGERDAVEIPERPGL
jgi:antitoxin VapB